MRKNKYVFIISLLLLFTILTGCKEKQSPLDIEFSFGYDDVLKVSAGNPLVATIKNNGKAFTGELQIEVDQSQNESIIYAKEFQIAENSEKEVHIVLPIYAIQRKFKVQVVADKQRIFEETISSGRFISPVQPTVAVISDQPDEYRFLNGAKYENYFAKEEVMNSYYNFGPQTEIVEETSSPEVFFFDSLDPFAELDNLEFFNYIYIGDNQNLKVSDKMEEKILNWVSAGGTLFIESGDDYKRLYSFLPESLTNFNVQSVSQVSKETIFNKYELNGPLTIVSGEAINNEFAVNFEEDGYNLAQYTKVNQGQIINLLVDLTQESLDNWPYKSQMIDEFLRRGINASYSLFVNSDPYNNGSYEYYDMLRYIPSEKKPPYGVMAIVFFIYVILAGPVLYFILKKKDRRDYMWIGVPALSVICLLLLYVFGFGTRYTKPIINSISNIEISDGDTQMKIDSKMAVFNNRQGNMDLTWDSLENVKITSDPYNYYGTTSASKKIKGKITTGNQTTYEVYDTPLWSKVNLEASKLLPLEITSDGQFITFDMNETSINMTVYNKTPFDLQTAFVQWGSSYIYVGELLGGESKEVEVLLTKMFTDIYTFNEAVHTIINASDKDEAAKTKLNSNMEMFLRLSGEYYGNPISSNSGFNDITLKGVNESDIGYDLEVNGGKVDSFNRNIVTINSTIEFEPGTIVDLPVGFIMPIVKVGMNDSNMYPYNINSSGFDKKTVSVYGENIVEYSFDIPPYIDIDTMKLTLYPAVNEQDYWNKNEFETTPILPNVSYQLFDVLEQSYLEYAPEDLGQVIELDSMRYVDDGYKLKIQIHFDQVDSGLRDYGKIMPIPEISIEGRAR